MKRVKAPAWMWVLLVMGLSIVLGVGSIACIVALGESVLWDIAIFVSVPGFVGSLFAIGPVLIEESVWSIPIPWPCREAKLKKRLKHILKTKREIEGTLYSISEDNPYRVGLQSRLRELTAAEEVLKAEMAYSALRKLDKRAASVVRKELSN